MVYKKYRHLIDYIIGKIDPVFIYESRNSIIYLPAVQGTVSLVARWVQLSEDS
jgi:hypothetical protein